MDNSLIPSFETTLFDGCFDLSIEYLELTLDAITENEIFKGIPLVGSFVTLGKTAVAVRDRHLLRKTLEFIRTVNSIEPDREKINKHRNKFENNQKELRKELERVLILLDNQIEEGKSRILANFYYEYACENIDWEDFMIFANILDFVSLYDIKELKYLYDVNILNKENYTEVNIIAIKKLSSVGLVDFYNGQLVNVGEDRNILAKITTVGKNFYEIAMRKKD